MVARSYTVAFEGVTARLVEVQCATSPGLPGFTIVGLPDKAVSEAKERVRAALSAMSIALPSKRITVPEFAARKNAGRKICMLTAYDFSLAAVLDHAGVRHSGATACPWLSRGMILLCA